MDDEELIELIGGPRCGHFISKEHETQGNLAPGQRISVPCTQDIKSGWMQYRALYRILEENKAIFSSYIERSKE